MPVTVEYELTASHDAELCALLGQQIDLSFQLCRLCTYAETRALTLRAQPLAKLLAPWPQLRREVFPDESRRYRFWLRPRYRASCRTSLICKLTTSDRRRPPPLQARSSRARSRMPRTPSSQVASSACKGLSAMAVFLRTDSALSVRKCGSNSVSSTCEIWSVIFKAVLARC